MKRIKDAKLYTHKFHESEIFIKNTSRISDNHFQANFRLIKNHGFYSDFLACQSKINPFFLLECARQAETVLSHTEFAIAVDSKFLLDRWSITYYPTGFDDTGTLKADVYTKEPTTKKTNKNTFNIVFKLKETVIGVVKIEVRYITNSCYKRIRRIANGNTFPKISTPLLPATVCFTSQENVVLADLSDEGPYVKATIYISNDNKSLNDHEQDHITGMNLTEAAKQICYSYISLYMKEKNNCYIPIKLEANFYSYVEKHIPAVLGIKKVTLQDNLYLFDVDIIQNEKTLATVNLKLGGEYG